MVHERYLIALHITETKFISNQAIKSDQRDARHIQGK